MIGIKYRRVEASFIQSEDIRMNITLIHNDGYSLLKWIEQIHAALAERVQDPDAWFLQSFHVLDMAQHVWQHLRAQNMHLDPNYCQEHGDHMRDSPACDLARERERRHAARS